MQQQDAHVGSTSVREALQFAAVLKLPVSVTSAQRLVIVENVLEMLELRSVADCIIGEAEGQGITASQRKRLTIGVELVGGPSVLFVDGE